MKVSDLFIKCLENEGVKYIFGVPGEEILDLMDSLLSSSIKFIPTRHEQGAAFMADVYGRLTGKAGVCLATLGPGATNLTTGVADANLDRAPLVAITGQSDLKKIHKESHQYIDIVQNFSPITKWNARITHGDVVPEVVRKAFLIAQTEKPGATHIEIAENIAKSESHNKPLKVTPNPRFHPDHEDIEIASKLIKNSNYPIILGGNGIIRGRASKELIEFAKKNNIPVANTFMGKGIIPSNHRLYLSTVGLQAKDHVMCGFDLADLVITIGYDMVEYAPSFWNSLADKKIIHIDTQRSEVDTYYVPDIELIGDIKSTLKILIEKTGFKKDVEYIHYLKKTIEKEFEELKDDVSFPIKPQKV
ncbi:MAG: thiamine pyrophosphate-binding protein, partial [Methanosarcinales archaeon]